MKHFTVRYKASAKIPVVSFWDIDEDKVLILLVKRCKGQRWESWAAMSMSVESTETGWADLESLSSSRRTMAFIAKA